MNQDLIRIIKDDMVQNKGKVLTLMECIHLFVMEKYNPLTYIIVLRIAHYVRKRRGIWAFLIKKSIINSLFDLDMKYQSQRKWVLGFAYLIGEVVW